MQSLSVIAALLLSAGPATRPADAPESGLPPPVISEHSGVAWYKDVAYVEGEGAHPRKHRLDLLVPPQGKWRAGRPMLIWIHGGGWVMGDKDDALGLYTRYCRLLAENGVATANISYRLSPGVKHPAHIEDAAAATAWVIRHAEEIGFDPQAVFVSGHSAGGHLAALLAADHRWLEARGLPRGIIRGAIPSSGVFDLAPLLAGGERWQRAFAPDDAAAASPVTHVDANDPPFVFMIEGNGAFMQRQTKQMAEALRDAKVQEKIVVLPAVNHITMLADLLDPKGLHLSTTLAFIDEVLKAGDN